MIFRVFNIKWDTGRKQVSLPNEMIVEVEDEDEIADILSNITGYCHFSFECKEVSI